MSAVIGVVSPVTSLSQDLVRSRELHSIAYKILARSGAIRVPQKDTAVIRHPGDILQRNIHCPPFPHYERMIPFGSTIYYLCTLLEQFFVKKIDHAYKIGSYK